MSSSLPQFSHPEPEDVAQAWRGGFVISSTDEESDEVQLKRWTFLQGLPRLLKGEVRDQDKAIEPRAALNDLLNRKDLNGWLARDEQNGVLPFAAELAARLLALGYLDRPNALTKDRLLAPILIDRECDSDTLTLARAVAAIGLESSILLTTVLARHVSRPERGAPIFEAVLRDNVAHCLLVNGLSQRGDVKDEWVLALIRRLVAQRSLAPVGQDRARTDPPVWLDGPLLAVWALGRLFQEPDNRVVIADFARYVARWKGWSDKERWPIRIRGGNLSALQAALTERVADALGVGDRKLWQEKGMGECVKCWPALDAFCFPAQ